MTQSGHYMEAGSHPVLYSLSRYLFASGTFVIFKVAASYFNKWPVLNATAYKLMASVMCSASEKLPGYCFPVLQASVNNDNAAVVLSTWLRASAATAPAGASIFLPEMICGF